MLNYQNLRKTSEFAEVFPQRFFNVGIAEQNLWETAAGLATTGKIPFVSTIVCHICHRKSFEQIRNTIDYPKLNVKIAATHAGITVMRRRAYAPNSRGYIINEITSPTYGNCAPSDDAVETEAAIRGSRPSWKDRLYIPFRQVGSSQGKFRELSIRKGKAVLLGRVQM
jgi:transketolase